MARSVQFLRIPLLSIICDIRLYMFVVCLVVVLCSLVCLWNNTRRKIWLVSVRFVFKNDISSHENKKILSLIYHEKIYLIENECKIPSIGCLTFIFHQKYFYDKMDLRVFYFHVTIYMLKNLKENFTQIHEIWVLFINYNFLWFYYDLFKYQKIDNCSWDIYIFSHTETCFCTFSQ